MLVIGVLTGNGTTLVNHGVGGWCDFCLPVHPVGKSTSDLTLNGIDMIQLWAINLKS